MRGQLTPEVAARAKELLGYDITVTELRLMPYIQFVLMNEQRLDPRKINDEERKILQRWRKAKRIQGGAGGLSITREFWDILNELMFMAYVEGGATE